VEDQRFIADRDDVVSWQSEVLDSDLVVTGDIVAHLFASTSGTDSDWVVKLIDVYPDNNSADKSMAGYQLMIAEEIFRGRYRQSYETPAATPADQVNEYVIDLYTFNHCFRKGHRLMVQVQSTWFPLYDRNPQKFVENIFKATPADFQAATQRVYQSPRYSSYVSLPVMR
jgi:putative CocE/NonD family hydrolase